MTSESNSTQNSTAPISRIMTPSSPNSTFITLDEGQYNNMSDQSQNLPSSSLEEVHVNVDEIMTKLLELKSSKPGAKADLKESDIYGIVHMVKNILMAQPMLLQLDAPIQVCGDIHGQYYDLLRLFEYGGFPPSSSYLFLGDYVDRGQYGIETICLLYCLKIKFPKKVFLLRGNHQSFCISKQYGFYAECKKRYDVKIWKCFLSSFVFLPVAALISDRIICMHGGLSPEMYSFDQIGQIVRPQQVPEQGLLCDLLWADPTTQHTGWAESERGCSYIFGSDVTHSFLKANDLDLVCRAHQVVEDGYEFCHKKQVVTLFSAPNYCGEFDNSGAIMRVDADLRCSFLILRPENKLKPFKNVKSRDE